jgi:hypothetical protein
MHAGNESTLFLVRVWHRTEPDGSRRFCASVSAAGSRSAEFFNRADDVARFLDAAGRAGGATTNPPPTGGPMTTLRMLAAACALSLLLAACKQAPATATAPLDNAQTLTKVQMHQPPADRTAPSVTRN